MHKESTYIFSSMRFGSAIHIISLIQISEKSGTLLKSTSNTSLSCNTCVCSSTSTSTTLQCTTSIIISSLYEELS